MVLIAHLAKQLAPSVLRLHWSTLNFRIPTFASSNLWVGLVMFAVYVAVMAVRVAIFIVAVVVVVVAGLLQWRLRSSIPAERVADGDDDIVLVLRPFGGDGRLVLNPTPIPGRGEFFPRTRLIESIVGEEVARVHAVPVGILDQRRRLVPGGVRYHPAGDDWLEIVRTLAARASAVVVLVPPASELRDGLDAELDMLATDGRSHKTVLVASSGDRIAESVMRAAAQRLGWGTLGTRPIVAFATPNGVRQSETFDGDAIEARVVQAGVRDALAAIRTRSERTRSDRTRSERSPDAD